MQKYKLLINLVILAALVNLVMAGWLAGHILRYSNPALWHPPVPEAGPQIRTGFEIEGIPRLAVFAGNLGPNEEPSDSQTTTRSETEPANPLERCIGSDYFTSLPAKCHSVNGRLVPAAGNQSEFMLLPPD